MQHIITLVSKDLRLELRRKSVLAGLGLYLFSLVFVCYMTFTLQQGAIGPTTWAALFWLTVLFSSVNVVARSFIGERKGVLLYFYMVASAQAVIMSRIITNLILSLVLAVGSYLLFKLLIADPISDDLAFLVVLFLVCWGLSASLSLISGLASKAKNSHVVMAVLSFPVVIAVMLLAIRITTSLIGGFTWADHFRELLNLLGINLIASTLAYLLFPYIWRS